MTRNMAGQVTLILRGDQVKTGVVLFHLRRPRSLCNVEPVDAPPLYPVSQSPPPRRRTGWIVYAVIITFFLFISALANLALFGFVFGKGHGSSIAISEQRRYEERFVDGEEDAKDKIVVIYVSGIISSAEDGYSSEGGMVADIEDQLQQAEDDKHVKAIILRINSPGGEVVASDEIYQAVLAARVKKKVVASIDTVGASGAYYIAVGADWIVANELSITGSIGVIMESFTYGDLAQ